MNDNTQDLADVVAAMHRYGGSFADALASAMERADLDNLTRILQAFPELIAKYRGMVQQAKDAP